MMTVKATLTVDTAETAVDKHARALRTPKELPSQEMLQQETAALSALLQQLAGMGHSTSIVAQLLQMSHAQLITKARDIRRGRLVSLAPSTLADVQALQGTLSRLPQTAEEGLAMMHAALAAYGRDGIGTLKSLAEYLGVSYVVLHRWRTEPPKRIKIDHLLALRRLADRGVISWP